MNNLVVVRRPLVLVWAEGWVKKSISLPHNEGYTMEVD